MKREESINRESAEAEFKTFLIEMDIDFDAIERDSGEDKAADLGRKDRVIRAIMYGDLIFNDHSEPVYTPWRNNSKYKEPLTFHERRGQDLIASDNKGKNALAKQTYAMMGSMCRVEPKIFAGMAGSDIKVCEALFGLLMG